MAVISTDTDTYIARCSGCSNSLTIEISDDDRWDDQEFAALENQGWELKDAGYFCVDCKDDAPESYMEFLARKTDEARAERA